MTVTSMPMRDANRVLYLNCPCPGPIMEDVLRGDAFEALTDEKRALAAELHRVLQAAYQAERIVLDEIAEISHAEEADEETTRDHGPTHEVPEMDEEVREGGGSGQSLPPGLSLANPVAAAVLRRVVGQQQCSGVGQAEAACN